MKFELSERYKSKILKSLDLSKIIGNISRSDTVVLCHGVFDIVHPGHIRHLLYAKSKAKKLIVSLTADKHINKGVYRPHIPEELRALNLAALEFVDYVIIDENSTPLENLKILQPNLYVKGFEYNIENRLNEKTLEEIEVMKTIGGEVIFSPGDFTASSSQYILHSPPNLRVEKLILLMQRAGISFSDLINTLNDISNITVHVVGDIIMDSYTRCTMIGGQTKTPTMSVKFESKTDILGGAGIVAAHLKSAGAKVKLTSIIGDDELGNEALRQIAKHKIEPDIIIDNDKPTTTKNAIIVGDYRLLKVDTLDNRPISIKQQDLIMESINKSKSQIYIFSDFRHGIFNKQSINNLIKAIPDGAMRVADSQVASRWGNILDFKGFDLITPNEREARFSLGDQDSGIRTLASDIYHASKSKNLIMKLGDKGIISYLDSEAETLDSYFIMDSFADQCIDPVGAGDALLAYACLSLKVSNNLIIASILGNLAAACECETDQNSPVTPSEILKKIENIERNVNRN